MGQKSDIFSKHAYWAAGSKANEQLQHSFSHYWNQRKSHRVLLSDGLLKHPWDTPLEILWKCTKIMDLWASRCPFHFPSSSRHHKHYIWVFNSINLHDCRYSDEWEFVRFFDVFDALWLTSDVESQGHLCSLPCFFLLFYILKCPSENTSSIEASFIISVIFLLFFSYPR